MEHPIDVHDELRGSAPAMTTKDLLLEVYHDMKFVRPAVEALQGECLPARVDVLEKDKITRDAAWRERQRLGGISNKALLSAILVGQFALAVWVAVANGLHL